MTKVELRKMVQELNGVTGDALEKITDNLMSQLDVDNSGAISFKEFMNNYQKMLSNATEETRGSMDTLRVRSGLPFFPSTYFPAKSHDLNFKY
jgi:Ca2+-binding EF-hand superfamily protein